MISFLSFAVSDISESAKAKDSGEAIGSDITEEMLENAIRNATQNGYTNVEFKKGDVERRIPIDDNIIDVK